VASTIVGFSPAVPSTGTTGAAATAPQAEGGAPNLFAMLLALVGAPSVAPAETTAPGTPPAGTTPTTPVTTTTVPLTFAVPATTAADTAETAPQPQPAPIPAAAPLDPLLAEAATTETGKSLLRDLGDVLIAVNDALDSGRPLDPALEKKLNAAVDAVATYLGTLTATAPIETSLAAVAGGKHVLPAPTQSEIALPPADDPAPTDSAEATPAITLDATIPAPPPIVSTAAIAPATTTLVTPPAEIDTTIPADAPAAPTGESVPTDATTALAASAKPAAPAIPAEFATLLQGLGIDLPLPTTPDEASAPTAPAHGTSTEPAANPAPAATTVQQAPPALQALGLVIAKLAQRLEPQDPELARKLDALAEGLKSGTVPEAVTAALELDTSKAEPEVARIIEALTAPKSTTVTAPAPQPFIAARLALPDEVMAPEPAKPASEAPPTQTAPVERPRTETATPAPSPAAPLLQPEEATSEPTPELTAAPGTGPEAKPEAKQATASPASQASAPAATALAAAATPLAPPAETPVPIARAHAAYQSPLLQVNVPQVAFEIARQFEAGNSRFQIRLDPADLGRIDVSLEVEQSGTVSARMIVERPETLDLMQRDQRALQQALQQAGLDASKTSLEFSLRQNPFAGQSGMGDGQQGQPRFGGGNGNGAPGDIAGADTKAAPTTLYRATASAGGVNLFV
jgi:flagellar hook-length control protein FliK